MRESEFISYRLCLSNEHSSVHLFARCINQPRGEPHAGGDIAHERQLPIRKRHTECRDHSLLGLAAALVTVQREGLSYGGADGKRI